jgi:hypothetical protein
MFGTYRTRLFAFCLLVIAWSSTNAQNSKQPIEKDAKLEAQINAEPPVQSVTLVLTGGGQIVADEVSEDSDGYWYKRGNVSTFIQRSRVSRIDRPKLAESVQSRPIQGNGKWKLSDAARVKDFFLAKFNRPLPLSSFGQSDLHTRWGWDHRNGMDVGLHPDSVEGRALIAFLRDESIPFLAFRSAIPGVATGPHIHIGNPSPRISSSLMQVR